MAPAQTGGTVVLYYQIGSASVHDLTGKTGSTQPASCANVCANITVSRKEYCMAQVTLV
ncbi:hypothetical protein GGR37_002786 [Novosphingobium taihuense]|uniref:Uncharacterized protein n=1 Tax=Novosphingobium taihuense TaxID=260085 RepID=A0A7W7ACH4_9SPHN|nr:hypothetical protein [Novosphingobium taihuense]